MFAIL